MPFILFFVLSLNLYPTSHLATIRDREAEKKFAQCRVEFLSKAISGGSGGGGSSSSSNSTFIITITTVSVTIFP